MAARQLALLDPDQPRDIREFWEHYKELGKSNWKDRALHKMLAYKEYLEQLEYMHKYHRAINELTNNAVGCLIYLLLLPVLLPCDIYLQSKCDIAKDALDALLQEQQLRDLSYKATQKPLRTALKEHDLENGTRYLEMIDRVVKDMAQKAYSFFDELSAREQQSAMNSLTQRIMNAEEKYQSQDETHQCRHKELDEIEIP